MIKIYIDKKKFKVYKHSNLLDVCLSQNLNLPYFCWHPALGSVGSCRQCAVKQYANFQDKQGRIVMACMTPLYNNAVFSIEDKEVTFFRRKIIEIMMTNHPHDCPVCDEGGQCHLQDMTVMTQHYSRKYRFEKKVCKNQYLGPFISQEMNRCISCYKCVRYYKDYADGDDFNVYGIGTNLFFGRKESGKLQSEHSGNLVEICPTGVFTDKVKANRYNRKWDMQYAPSICQYCSIGCNTVVGEKYGRISSIENRYNKNINHYFLCDLGRFNYDYGDFEHRIVNPAILKKKKISFLKNQKVLLKVKKTLEKSSLVVGIGSPRASVESNFALQELVKKKNFSIGLEKKDYKCNLLILDILKKNSVYSPSLREIEKYDSILIVGEDLTQTSPRASLSVRQAVKNKKYNFSRKKNIPLWNTEAIKNVAYSIKRNDLYVVYVDKTKLNDISKLDYCASVEEQINLLILVYKIVRKDIFPEYNFSSSANSKNYKKARLIALSLLKSRKPLVISGSSLKSQELIKISYNIARLLKIKNEKVGLSLFTYSANALGVGILGGISINKALKKCAKKQNSTLIVMENDLYYSCSSRVLKKYLKKIKNIIVLDYLFTKTVKRSNYFFPAATVHESSGSFINFQGKIQRFFKVYNLGFYKKNINVKESWKWIYEIKSIIKNDRYISINLDDVISQCSKKNFFLKNMKSVAPTSKFRVHGQKIARFPFRASGRTSILSHINVHEPSQLVDHDTMFSFSTEGYRDSARYSSEIPFPWYPGWNSNQSWNKLQKNIFGSLLAGDTGSFITKKNNKKNKIDFFKINKKKNVFISLKKYFVVVPIYSLFKSEEISHYSKVLCSFSTDVTAKINNIDGKKLGIYSSTIIFFNILEQNYSIRINVSKFFPRFQLGLPIGHEGYPLALIGEKAYNIRVKKYV